MDHSNGRGGLTLTELLISTAIVGIMMVGIVSAEYAVRRADNISTMGALLNLRAQSIMAHVGRNAALAVGTLDDPGVRISGVAPDASACQITSNNCNYFCFRQDVSNPASFSDDQWVCYTRRTNDLYTCIWTNAQGPNACPVNGSELLGSVTADIFDDGDQPRFTLDSATKRLYFEITLKSRYNPAVTYRTVVAQEYLSNPKIKLTAKIAPAAHSAN